MRRAVGFARMMSNTASVAENKRSIGPGSSRDLCVVTRSRRSQRSHTHTSHKQPSQSIMCTESTPLAMTSGQRVWFVPEQCADWRGSRVPCWPPKNATRAVVRELAVVPSAAVQELILDYACTPCVYAVSTQGRDRHDVAECDFFTGDFVASRAFHDYLARRKREQRWFTGLAGISVSELMLDTGVRSDPGFGYLPNGCTYRLVRLVVDEPVWVREGFVSLPPWQRGVDAYRAAARQAVDAFRTYVPVYEMHRYGICGVEL